jgi:SSS family solute:Na+ symporter
MDGDIVSVPWPTLLTGMMFIQVFYWSTNQVIVQRALAAKSLAEGQKGVLSLRL